MCHHPLSRPFNLLRAFCHRNDHVMWLSQIWTCFLHSHRVNARASRGCYFRLSGQTLHLWSACRLSWGQKHPGWCHYRGILVSSPWLQSESGPCLYSGIVLNYSQGILWLPNTCLSLYATDPDDPPVPISERGLVLLEAETHPRNILLKFCDGESQTYWCQVCRILVLESHSL